MGLPCKLHFVNSRQLYNMTKFYQTPAVREFVERFFVSATLRNKADNNRTLTLQSRFSEYCKLISIVKTLAY